MIRSVRSYDTHSCGKGGGLPGQTHQYHMEVGSRFTRQKHWDKKSNVLTRGRKEGELGQG